MNGKHIEKLKPEDYPKCSNIWNMERNPEQTEKWRREIENGEREVYIYIIDDEFIGEIAFFTGTEDTDYYIPGQRIYLSRLIVRDGYRRRGIGGELIDFMCGLALERGYREVSLGVDTVNESARRLYSKKGFDTVIYHGTDHWGEYLKLVKKLRGDGLSV